MKYQILHINASTGFAGAERVLLNYLNHYDRERFSVQVATYINHQRQVNSFTQKMGALDIPFHKILIGNCNFLAAVSKTAQLIRAEKINLVHTHGYRSDVTGLLAAKMGGVPILSTVHGWTPISQKLRVYEKIDRLALKGFDGVIAVSRDIFRTCINSGIRSSRLRLIHNAVPASVDGCTSTDRAGKSSVRSRIILSVGRLSYEKGYDILLQSFATLSAKDDTLKLIIVGDGPLRHDLERMAEEVSCSAKVEFVGYTENVESYYETAELFVLPSRTEGLPMVILEAMLVGLPVICSRVGGVPELISSGENGLLVDPENVGDLEAAMAYLLNDSSLAGRIGKAGMATVNHGFSTESWVRQIENFYGEIIANYGNR